MPDYDSEKGRIDAKYGTDNLISTKSQSYIDSYVSHGGLNNSSSNKSDSQTNFDPTNSYGPPRESSKSEDIILIISLVVMVITFIVAWRITGSIGSGLLFALGIGTCIGFLTR
jgi:hypothetical protein